MFLFVNFCNELLFDDICYKIFYKICYDIYYDIGEWVYFLF